MVAIYRRQQRPSAEGRQLDEKSSAIVVLDKNGRVQWAKDGALTQQEVQQVIDLLHKLLNK